MRRRNLSKQLGTGEIEERKAENVDVWHRDISTEEKDKKQ